VDTAVGDFLKNRRARLLPADVGLPPRVARYSGAGLRREDVAQLASVSVDYYTRLEQGRAGAVSDAVLDAVADALRLSAVERAHLRHIARPPADENPQDVGDGSPHDRLLSALTHLPALVIDCAMDVVAANPLAVEVFGLGPDGSGVPVNLAERAVDDAGPGSVVEDQERVASAAVGYLRYQAGLRPGHPRLTAVVDGLHARSALFRALWADQTVRYATSLRVRVDHASGGSLHLRNRWLTDPQDTGIAIVYYLPDDDAETERRLDALAGALAANGPAPAPH
jgi:transcriptional regulator with XRE-family HTH domain/ADP-ribose pyrophosphatase YjhB (NUDIX family)